MQFRAANSSKLPCGITFVLEGEEEIGSPHIVQFVREHADLLKCHAAIWRKAASTLKVIPEPRWVGAAFLSVETRGANAEIRRAFRRGVYAAKRRVAIGQSAGVA